MRLIRNDDVRSESITTKVYPLIPTIMWIVRPDMEALVGGFYRWILVLWEHDLTSRSSRAADDCVFSLSCKEAKTGCAKSCLRYRLPPA